jgi:hypothetical protein
MLKIFVGLSSTLLAGATISQITYQLDKYDQLCERDFKLHYEK